jgi:hypothetical protein
MRKISSLKGLSETVGEGGTLEIVLDEDFVPIEGARLVPRSQAQRFRLRFLLKDGIVYLSRPSGEHRNPFVKVKVVAIGANTSGYSFDSEMLLSFRELPYPLETLGLLGGRVELSTEGKPSVLSLELKSDGVHFYWTRLT